MPVDESQLELGMRVVVEFEPGKAASGTVIREYLVDDSNGNNNNRNGSRMNSTIESNNNSTIVVKNNNSVNNNHNKQDNNDRLLVNLTVRLDENGYNVSVANKTIWLLPVQMEDKGDMLIYFLSR